MRLSFALPFILIATAAAWSQPQIDPNAYYSILGADGKSALGLSRDEQGRTGLELIEPESSAPLHQLFRFVPAGGSDEYRIIGAAFQMALTGGGAGMIFQSPLSSDPKQLVVLEEAGKDLLRLRFKYSGLYFKAIGGFSKFGGAIAEGKKDSEVGGDLFKLRLSKTATEVDRALNFRSYPVETKVYHAIESVLSGLRLNIRGDSDESGKDLYQDGDPRKRPSGEFRFLEAGKGLYRIFILQSGKALSAALGGREGGAFVQADRSDSSRQLFRLKALEGGFLKIVAAYSGRVMIVEASATWHGTTMREGRERNQGNEVFKLIPLGELAREATALEAWKLVREGSRLAKEGKKVEAEAAALSALSLAPEEGTLLSDIGSLLKELGNLDQAAVALERALGSPDFAPRSLRELFDLRWKRRDFDAAIQVADKAIAYWGGLVSRMPGAANIKNELIEAWAIKSNAYNQLADWKRAIEAADSAFTVDPETRNSQLIYAKGEALHITAGLAAAAGDFDGAARLIDAAIAVYEGDKKLDRSGGRYSALLLVRGWLQAKKDLVGARPASIQRVLGLIVGGIDLDQAVNGKLVKIKDGFPEAARQRLKAGQAWYALYVEVMTKGQLRIEFTNVDVGVARRVNAEGLVQIETDSIEPPVAPLIYEYQNYDCYAFYWNGATSGLNGGTGIGGGYWPLTLAGVRIGQPRGFTVMATNPESYGVIDGLLQHEYGHVLEVMAAVTFVHCANLSDADRKRLLDLGWDGKCDDIYPWILSQFLKGRYADVNWARRYPAKLTQADFESMMRLNQASASPLGSEGLRE